MSHGNTIVSWSVHRSRGTPTNQLTLAAASEARIRLASAHAASKLAALGTTEHLVQRLLDPDRGLPTAQSDVRELG